MNIVIETVKKIVDFNYKKVLKKIRNKAKNKTKINVIFLVSENQKWAYESVYCELKKSKIFNPHILISYPKDLKLNKEEKDQFLKENFEFYSKIDSKAEFIYKNGKYESLRKYKPDIIFYEQQWGLPRIYKPYFVSFYALTYFSCYGIQMFDYSCDYLETFHYFLYRYLVDFCENFLRFKKYNKKYTKNCIVSGYPKLDKYFDCTKNKNEKTPAIIYAPHHSFCGGLNCGTFDKNGEFILSFAIETKNQINWIFKPHPRLKKSLIENNIMTKEQVETYYSNWNKIGKLCSFGNYFDLFCFSDILITDCCSYLGEYFFTNNPVIRLVNKNAIKLNEFGSKIVKNYIECTNVSGLRKLVLNLVSNLKRNEININKYIKKRSSKIILESLLKEIKTEDESRKYRYKISKKFFVTK